MTQRDYGRKPYVSNLRYPEFIRTTAAKAIWDNVTEVYPNLKEFEARRDKLSAQEIAMVRYIKQSELKKPYNADDYQGMEYNSEIPGFPTVDFPKKDQPWNLQTPYDPTPEGVRCVFDLESDSEYCPGQTTTGISVTGTYPIEFIQLTMTDDGGTTLSNINGLGSNLVTFDLIAGPSETGPVTVEGVMRGSGDCSGVVGYSNVNIPEKDPEDCPSFIFTILTDEGDDADSSKISGFTVYRSEGGTSTINTVYDAGENEWTIYITANPSPSNQYWVKYTAAGGTNILTTQYPYRYKTADQQLVGDKIGTGVYSDTMPYFECVSNWQIVTPACHETLSCATCSVTPCSVTQPCETGYSPSTDLELAASGVVRYEAEIKSSIPYEVRMWNPYANIQTFFITRWEEDTDSDCVADSCFDNNIGGEATATFTGTTPSYLPDQSDSGLPQVTKYDETAVSTEYSLSSETIFYQMAVTAPSPYQPSCGGGTVDLAYEGWGILQFGITAGNFDARMDMTADWDY